MYCRRHSSRPMRERQLSDSYLCESDSHVDYGFYLCLMNFDASSSAFFPLFQLAVRFASTHMFPGNDQCRCWSHCRGTMSLSSFLFLFFFFLHSTSALTLWVSYDGYIRHQNDHLSGRMTDISVMGEWQVAGVGGSRPLRDVLGEALKGGFSFEARKYLSSFQTYVHFEEFFCFHAFVRFGAKRSISEAFGFDDVLKLFLKLRSVTGHLFANSDYDREYFWKLPFFFQSRASVTCITAVVIPRLSKAFGDGTSKVRMKTSLPGVGEIERRRTADRRRDWYESLAVIHGPKEKKNTKKSSCDCAKSQPLIIFKTSEFRKTCF